MKIVDTTVCSLKKTFGIYDMSLFLRKKRQNIEKLFYHKKYSSDDIISAIKECGVKPGFPLVIHSAMGNLYNYTGTVDELIDKLIDFVGPEGTLCMPAYPADKFNESKIFDVKNDKTVAGYLAETFRKRPGVKRSLNKLHSVCALGKDAEKITSEHHLSITSFDIHSPYYIIAELGGYTVNIGLPKWFIGTGDHVCESILFGKLDYFTQKFAVSKQFKYIDEQGKTVFHTMQCKSSGKYKYIRDKRTNIIDEHFDKSKYRRIKISNMWISAFDMQYLYKTLIKLALEGKTIYKKEVYER